MWFLMNWRGVASPIHSYINDCRFSNSRVYYVCEVIIYHININAHRCTDVASYGQSVLFYLNISVSTVTIAFVVISRARENDQQWKK